LLEPVAHRGRAGGERNQVSNGELLIARCGPPGSWTTCSTTSSTRR